MCPKTSVGWWLEIPINCCKNSAINIISLCSLASLFCTNNIHFDVGRMGWCCFFLGEWRWLPVRICGAFPWSPVKWQMPTTTRRQNASFWCLPEPLRVGLKRHISATNQGAFVPFHPAQITCPLDLRLTEIQVAKTGGRVGVKFGTQEWFQDCHERGYLYKIHTWKKSHDTTSYHSNKICTTFFPLSSGLCSKSHASRCLSQPT